MHVVVIVSLDSKQPVSQQQRHTENRQQSCQRLRYCWCAPFKKGGGRVKGTTSIALAPTSHACMACSHYRYVLSYLIAHTPGDAMRGFTTLLIYFLHLSLYISLSYTGSLPDSFFVSLPVLTSSQTAALGSVRQKAAARTSSYQDYQSYHDSQCYQSYQGCQGCSESDYHSDYFPRVATTGSPS